MLLRPSETWPGGLATWGVCRLLGGKEGQLVRPRVRDPAETWEADCLHYCAWRDTVDILASSESRLLGRGLWWSPRGSRWPQVGGTLSLFSKHVWMPSLCQGTALGTGDSEDWSLDLSGVTRIWPPWGQGSYSLLSTKLLEEQLVRKCGGCSWISVLWMKEITK